MPDPPTDGTAVAAGAAGAAAPAAAGAVLTWSTFCWAPTSATSVHVPPPAQRAVTRCSPGLRKSLRSFSRLAVPEAVPSTLISHESSLEIRTGVPLVEEG